jgi:hypothetical protein
MSTDAPRSSSQSRSRDAYATSNVSLRGASVFMGFSERRGAVPVPLHKSAGSHHPAARRRHPSAPRSAQAHHGGGHSGSSLGKPCGSVRFAVSSPAMLAPDAKQGPAWMPARDPMRESGNVEAWAT